MVAATCVVELATPVHWWVSHSNSVADLRVCVAGVKFVFFSSVHAAATSVFSHWIKDAISQRKNCVLLYSK